MRYVEYLVTVNTTRTKGGIKDGKRIKVPEARMSIEEANQKEAEEVGKDLAKLALEKNILFHMDAKNIEKILLFRVNGLHMSRMRGDARTEGHGGSNDEENLGIRNAAIFEAFKEHAIALMSVVIEKP